MFDPNVDPEMMTAWVREIPERLHAMDQRDEFPREIQDSWSNLMHLTPPKPCLTEDPASELDLLARRYLL